MTNKPGEVDLKQLRYFLAVAERRSLSGAAAHLRLTHPTVSEQIRLLEQQLKISLVLRGQRGIELTAAGAALAEAAQQILGLVDSKLRDVTRLGKVHSASSRLGLHQHLAVLIGPILSERIRDRFPEISLNIVEGLSVNIADWLLKGRLDAGFLYDNQDLSQFHTEPLFSEQLYLIATPNNLPKNLRKDGSIDFRSLQDLPLVMSSRSHSVREIIEREASKHGVAIRPVEESDSLLHMLTVAARMNAYTFLSRSCVPAESKELVLIPINPTIYWTAHFARAKDKPVTFADQTVKETVKAIIAESIKCGDLLPPRSPVRRRSLDDTFSSKIVTGADQEDEMYRAAKRRSMK